jgi:endonuclease/exonuclease/phosphatase family metal-dependent hydrolase
MRLATYNILHGRSTVDGHVDVERFRAAVQTLDVDVLALQEVDRDQPRSHRADLTTVASESGAAPEHRFVATLRGLPGIWTATSGEQQPERASYGIALLSRHPVDEWRVIPLPRKGRLTWVRHPGRWLHRPVRDEPRAAVAAVVRGPQGPLTVVNTHLSWLRGWNDHQLAILLEKIADLPRPLVLMGDLNMLPPHVAKKSGLVPLAVAHTYPVGEPVRQIDHILGDGAVRPLGPARSIDTGLSDHRALVVDVTLDSGGTLDA